MAEVSYAFSPSGIAVLALWILSIAYGMFVVLFGAAVHLLRKGLSSSTGNPAIKRSLLCVSIASFLLTTAAIVVSFIHVAFSGPIELVDVDGRYDVLDQNTSVQGQLQTITAVLLNLQIMVADMFLLWRCYVVWNKKAIVLKIVFPMVVVESVTGFVRLIWSGATPATQKPYVDPLEIIISMVYFVLLLAINLTMSMLIAFRIFQGSRAIRQFPGVSMGRRYLWLTYLIVECGATYWVCIILAIGVELRVFQEYHVSSLSTPQVMIFLQVEATSGAAIFPALLIVFIEVGRTTENLAASVAAHPMETGSSAMPRIVIEQSTETVVDFDMTPPLPSDGVLSSDKNWAMESESRIGGRSSDEAV
ncbi:hypothetical protein OE88DRAFT_1657184 [Heliocybe sulcata]|uniref:Uncharacterized protein n=1 Tax=Heliocybe sulcata TaxID=5364 RepID=A0A5C3N419_9AGAM|nr:hypothetical protein OE88DRAFT_1657184 [Heliocybe sulcata]